MSRRISRSLILLALLVGGVMSLSNQVSAQVTTAGISGLVRDSQGAVVPGVSVTAVHEPSGTTYSAVTQEDGRFVIPGMRIGGPYKVTVELSGFNTESRSNLELSLGVTQDLSFSLKLATVSETVDVIASASEVFSSSRTGAATSVSRDELAVLPTVSGRINDVTRLTPQSGFNGTFSGQDNRMNNITVDGSYFNNSFGLGGQPGDRTGVAPISLEAIEQVQVNIAPYDVRQGNFVGAGVNMVTRSGTNLLVGSVYTRYRNQDSFFVGREANGLAYNPGTYTTKDTGGWAGGPVIKNRLFAFGSFEKQSDVRPLTTFRSNAGGEPVGGSVTRVLASDLTQLSSYLSTNFKYETGPFDNLNKNTPAKPFLIKGDYNLNNSNKVTFRYSQLGSSTDVQVSSSSSAGLGRGTNSVNWLGYDASKYQILENFKSGIGEWNSTIGNSISNSLTVGYTTNDESRGAVPNFPFVDILDGNGTALLSFGPDPFTRNNELRYRTWQAQDSFTKFSKNHSLTFGLSLEKYHSDNVFMATSNGVYTYNTLADFYTDANGYLANQNRTVAPVTLRRYQVQYTNLPGLEKPLQQLEAWYVGGYAQDQWHLRSNVTVTAGVRVDTPIFKNTAYDNPAVDVLNFRDQDGSAVQYNSGKMPNATPLWSPRVGFNWDLTADQTTQVRGGTGVFTGKPAYVWISNQIGNTGLLTGSIQDDNVTNRPFTPNTAAYIPTTVTGAPATSLTLNVTDPDFKFPQTWRTNIAIDRQLPWGLVGTAEYLYNRDLNGIYYINANLPAAQSSFTGVDARPRWAGPACASAGQVGGCVIRINNLPGNQVVAAYVLKNQDIGRSWTMSGSLTKKMTKGFSGKVAYNYGESKNTVDAGSTASGTWTSIAQSADPNNPGLAFSQNSPGHRFFLSGSYSKQYFGFGATTISAFWEARTNSPNFATYASYVFAGDMNGDGVSNNDLIYIPRNTSEMNFTSFTTTGATGRTYTAAEQAAAFEAYIGQDPYLSKHRGEYAQRNGMIMPIVKRMDLSLSQEVFGRVRGSRHSGQIRFDITNFGNLVNHNWGVGQRPVIASSTSGQNLITLLTNPTVDANGAAAYRLALVNGAFPTTTFQTTTFSSDVYTVMLSFRYNFN
ncbi:MAG TPA: carboxypeptidase regulatory-like domain-containing protein [Vicinamibacterales bacterium]|nr:carboxypeptidase regulatory-like domain-containing protein [Vicinamibacterales bacterium]